MERPIQRQPRSLCECQKEHHDTILCVCVCLMNNVRLHVCFSLFLLSMLSIS